MPVDRNSTGTSRAVAGQFPATGSEEYATMTTGQRLASIKARTAELRARRNAARAAARARSGISSATTEEQTNIQTPTATTATTTPVAATNVKSKSVVVSVEQLGEQQTRRRRRGGDGGGAIKTTSTLTNVNAAASTSDQMSKKAHAAKEATAAAPTPTTTTTTTTTRSHQTKTRKKPNYPSARGKAVPPAPTVRAKEKYSRSRAYRAERPLTAEEKAAVEAAEKAAAEQKKTAEEEKKAAAVEAEAAAAAAAVEAETAAAAAAEIAAAVEAEVAATEAAEISAAAVAEIAAAADAAAAAAADAAAEAAEAEDMVPETLAPISPPAVPVVPESLMDNLTASIAAAVAELVIEAEANEAVDAIAAADPAPSQVVTPTLLAAMTEQDVERIRSEAKRAAEAEANLIRAAAQEEATRVKAEAERHARAEGERIRAAAVAKAEAEARAEAQLIRAQAKAAAELEAKRTLEAARTAAAEAASGAVELVLEAVSTLDMGAGVPRAAIMGHIGTKKTKARVNLAVQTLVSSGAIQTVLGGDGDGDVFCLPDAARSMTTTEALANPNIRRVVAANNDPGIATTATEESPPAEEPAPASSEATTIGQSASNREHIIKELLASEERYVATLHAVLESYAGAAAAGAVVSDHDLVLMFPPPLGRLYEKHSAHLQSLRARVADDGGSGAYGEIYERLSGLDELNVMDDYLAYMLAFPGAMGTIWARREDVPAFGRFLHEAQSKLRSKMTLGLEALLLEPVQRIPRYLLLLDKLLKATPAAHSDFKVLPEVMATMAELTRSLEDNIRASPVRTIGDIRAGSLSLAPDQLLAPMPSGVTSGAPGGTSAPTATTITPTCSSSSSNSSNSNSSSFVVVNNSNKEAAANASGSGTVSAVSAASNKSAVPLIERRPKLLADAALIRELSASSSSPSSKKGGAKYPGPGGPPSKPTAAAAAAAVTSATTGATTVAQGLTVSRSDGAAKPSSAAKPQGSSNAGAAVPLKRGHRRRLSKSDIGLPTTFEHVVHMGPENVLFGDLSESAKAKMLSATRTPAEAGVEAQAKTAPKRRSSKGSKRWSLPRLNSSSGGGGGGGGGAGNDSGGGGGGGSSGSSSSKDARRSTTEIKIGLPTNFEHVAHISPQSVEQTLGIVARSGPAALAVAAAADDVSANSDHSLAQYGYAAENGLQTWRQQQQQQQQQAAVRMRVHKGPRAEARPDSLFSNMSSSMWGGSSGGSALSLEARSAAADAERGPQGETAAVQTDAAPVAAEARGENNVSLGVVTLSVRGQKEEEEEDEFFV